MRLFRCAFLAVYLFHSLAFAAPPPEPGPVPDKVRTDFQLDAFYTKHLDVGGLPIVGSPRVSDAAMRECAWIVGKMLERNPRVLAALGEARVRFAVMAYDEYTTDIPEHAELEPKVFWDRRARGLGPSPTAQAVSAGEENLLAYPGDPYPREILAIHEFAHAIHRPAMRKVDPTFDRRLEEAYERAVSAGKWKGTYAGSNVSEYWAEGVQAWFDNNAANDALHNDVNTREKLQAYDPGLAALCAEVFGDNPWRYQKAGARTEEDRAHLASVPVERPRFQWRMAPLPEEPVFSLQTAIGNVDLQFAKGFQRSDVEPFLKEVHLGYFSTGKVMVTKSGIELTPASTTPDGSPVPANARPWRIVTDGNLQKGALNAQIIKGAEVHPKLIEATANDQAVAIQRIVRMN